MGAKAIIASEVSVVPVLGRKSHRQFEKPVLFPILDLSQPMKRQFPEIRVCFQDFSALTFYLFQKKGVCRTEGTHQKMPRKAAPLNLFLDLNDPNSK